jgi:hypothetical protein
MSDLPSFSSGIELVLKVSYERRAFTAWTLHAIGLITFSMLSCQDRRSMPAMWRLRLTMSTASAPPNLDARLGLANALDRWSARRDVCPRSLRPRQVAWHSVRQARSGLRNRRIGLAFTVLSCITQPVCAGLLGPRKLLAGPPAYRATLLDDIPAAAVMPAHHTAGEQDPSLKGPTRCRIFRPSVKPPRLR